MNRIPLVVGASITLAALIGQPALAQSPNRYCADRASLISQLEARHGETRRSAGLQEDSRVIETYANTETGTWTIIITMPTGIACLVAVGENWREEALVVSVPDEAA